MRLFRDLDNLPDDAKGSVLALGNFDGVHRGHLAILDATRAIAEREGAPLAVMTYEPHPRSFTASNLPQYRLPHRMTFFAEKARLLREAGVDILFVLRFSKEVARIPAEIFNKEWFHERLALRHVVTAEGFTYGKARKGTTDTITEDGRQYGFGCTVVSPLADPEVLGLPNLREAYKNGDVAEIARLLGRPYRITRPVIHGDGRGQALGYPTANLHLPNLYWPRYGVYAGRVRIEGEGEWRHAALSIGTRPMFHPDSKEAVLEAHLLDWQGDLYGKRLTVEPLVSLREEQVFASVEALQEQMDTDCQHARRALAEWKPPSFAVA